jgi:L-arabinose isomerase
MKIADIIQTEEDVEMAVKMGKWMTEALMAKMTTTLQVRQFGNAPEQGTEQYFA